MWITAIKKLLIWVTWMRNTYKQWMRKRNNKVAITTWHQCKYGLLPIWPTERRKANVACRLRVGRFARWSCYYDIDLATYMTKNVSLHHIFYCLLANQMLIYLSFSCLCLPGWFILSISFAVPDLHNPYANERMKN